MRTNIIFTLTGPDRIGIVEAVTRILLGHDGNVETSRMARLGGEFAMLVLVSLPEEQLAGLNSALTGLVDQGYKVTTVLTEQTYAESCSGWTPYQIEVHGADHEGIIHEIARHLSEHGITIESMDTGTSRAPVSGIPLFSMTSLVLVPPDLADGDWETALENVGRDLNVDITVSAPKGQQ